MSTRLRKVVHIEVFDYEGEIVSGKKEDPFSYTYQKEYYYGMNKIGERKYDSTSRKLLMNKNQLKSLKKKVDKALNKAFCYVEEDGMVDVAISGGSTILYKGNHPETFKTKILKLWYKAEMLFYFVEKNKKRIIIDKHTGD